VRSTPKITSTVRHKQIQDTQKDKRNIIDRKTMFILPPMFIFPPFTHVSVIALDFSKAFDTVRHYTLLEKMARPMLDIPDAVYNWLVDFFSGYSHNTSYGGATSTIKFVSASIIQGAANRLEHSQLRSTKPIVEANRFGILKFT